MPKIKDLPKHKRPREKLSEKGAANLTDAELLAILIRTGRAGKSALDIAKETLRKYPISELLAVSDTEMCSIKGLENVKAITIKAALELGQRAANSFSDALPIINSTKAMADQLVELRGKQKEHFVALYLNARNQLIHKETISIGTLNESLVHPREVFEPALRHFAASVVLAHNHPSNNPEPSQEDITLTEKLIQAGSIMDIVLLDHIIITNNGYTSLKEKGII